MTSTRLRTLGMGPNYVQQLVCGRYRRYAHMDADRPLRVACSSSLGVHATNNLCGHLRAVGRDSPASSLRRAGRGDAH